MVILEVVDDKHYRNLQMRNVSVYLETGSVNVFSH